MGLSEAANVPAPGEAGAEARGVKVLVPLERPTQAIDNLLAGKSK